MGHDNATKFADRGKASRHCMIIAEKPIPVQLQVIRKRSFEVVESERASGVPSNLNSLPGRKPTVNFALGLLDLLLHCIDFAIDVNRLCSQMFLEFFELLFELNNWFLKFQRLYLHLTMTGVSFATRANNSSISGAASIIPLAGFCALGAWGF